MCSGKENASDCDSDCDPPSCGDGFCEFGERSDCTEDCDAFSRVPIEWMGDPQEYVEVADEGATESDSADHQEGCSFGQGAHPQKPGAPLTWAVLGGLIWLRRLWRCSQLQSIGS